MVFYRKYRPQKIGELDSKSVRDKLYSVLGNPSVAHAFLFTGSKGLGKTSAARIVAKALNCERVQSSKLKVKSSERTEPCNKCEQCVSIMRGTNLDILEIDGASNRGIDEIRDLREKVRLSPASARKKVYIIDEVHMLTQEAFNALLKTLEEPPSHVVFILCTTEPHKVPSTILSRCLHIQFKKATREELVRSFARIALVEKLKFDKEALGLIASLSDGSFRDGAKILEEIALVAGHKKITKDLVEKEYHVSSIKYQVGKMLKFLEDRDTKAGLELVSKLAAQGTDMKFFMEELIQMLHSLLLQKAGVTDGLDVESSELDMTEIKKLVEMLAKAYGELKYAVLPQIPLELVIVEWGLSVRGPVGLHPRPTSSVASLPAGARQGSPAPATPLYNKPKITQQNITGYSENDALWITLIDKMKSYNHSIAGVLRGCRVKSYDKEKLVIEAGFKFHKERLEEQKTRAIIEKVCEEIAGNKVAVSVVMKMPA